MFDAHQEAEALRQQTRIIRKRSYSRRKSRLDQYKGELLALRREGCSIAELQRWLRKKRIKVVHSTVARWLEQQDG
ncbi:hypothetical protein CGK66_08735 [Vibrio parahaemolyticus]|uniref:hypothetical protein n=1 Tax=Marinomonas gallaica TaxID=1806667 RepID=UPI0001BC6C0B|nr:hypothetical protein [Photobacterium sp. ZSDE20]TNY59808.1 hypothetical protein CGK66_08735 [Vibrio parahaemolyticus]